jgi:hypothetical protein
MGLIAIVSCDERAERFEGLKALVERLGSPDLTLPEAKALRGRLCDLLARKDQPEGRHC